jgi:antitoxin (DNA-binding transcriptional repressor) of toxin-antitoxin stability system
MPSSHLAHNLDESAITGALLRRVAKGQSGVIAKRGTPDGDLIPVAGTAVARELGGRYLVRYVTRAGGARDVAGRDGLIYVTPTAYATSEAITWLALPGPRPFYLLLDPAGIETIAGPRYVHLGQGIEYLLPDGFPAGAVVGVGTGPGATWPLPVS